MRYALVLLICLLNLSCKTATSDSRFKDNSRLYSYFDICPWWHRGLDWMSINKIKRKLDHSELLHYVDKRQSNQWLKRDGFPVVKVLCSGYKDDAGYHYFSNNVIKQDSFQDACRHIGDDFVVKPTHMSSGNKVFVFKDGKNIKTGKTYNQANMLNTVLDIMRTPTNSDEVYLKKIHPGFLIQELIEDQIEFKYHVIWGQVVRGRVFLGKGNEYAGHFLKDGSKLDAGRALPNITAWREGARIAEAVAVKTDYLRVDMFYIKNENSSKGYLLKLNELEVSSGTYGPNQHTLSRLFNIGYADMCY